MTAEQQARARAQVIDALLDALEDNAPFGWVLSECHGMWRAAALDDDLGRPVGVRTGQTSRQRLGAY